MLNILFVATGPSNYDLPALIEYESIEELEHNVPKYIYNYLIEHDLLRYDDEYVELSTYDLPVCYQNHFLQKDKIVEHELQSKRDLVMRKIAELYPEHKTVTYSTCDFLIPKPNSFKIKNMIKETDKKWYEKTGIQMVFQKHYKMCIEEFVSKHQNQKFDMVWFLGLYNPHYVFIKDQMFITQFRKIMNNKHFILYSDPCYKSGVYIIHDLIDIKERYLGFDHTEETQENIEGIDYVLSHWITLQTGVYRFNR